MELPKIDTSSGQIIGLVIAGLTYLLGRALSAGKKADDQLAPATGSSKDEPTVRQLMEQNLQETRDGTAAAVRAENAATSAAHEAKQATSGVASLDKKIGDEVKRLDDRIDGVMKESAAAVTMARQALGQRGSDEAARREAAIATPPAGVPALRER